MNEEELITILRTDGRRGLALDIDDTLSDTNKFWFTNLQRLFGNPEKLTPQEMIQKYRYIQEVPYWQNSEVRMWIKKTY
ncbi:hypothetical protein COV17_03845 [Candidatus Woesearchaeota archaeon CG10_big_fil_rev_8_21_14_0_10_36_11]|nr:MAG: hypothetical protein COV17_03845 [Candidatus Woesearchaeota archaeon CG10_big_fil_rev_8_21_14_0_10_36_11]